MAVDDPQADRYDSSGARPSPAFPVVGNECLSLYGDSFVYANEVDDASAWGNVLTELVRCRVGNFGVGGYGIDQAYLRFSRNTGDGASLTMLGIYKNRRTDHPSARPSAGESEYSSPRPDGALAQELRKGELCAILSEPNGCRGHFNRAGNRMIAEIVYAYLRSELLLPAPRRDGN